MECPRSCNIEKINKSTIEQFVLSELENNILNDNNIPQLAHKIYEHHKKEKANESGEGKYLKKEIAKLENQINNIVDAISEGVSNSKSLVDKLNNLEKQKATLEKRFHEWQIKQDKELMSKEVIESYLQLNKLKLKEQDPSKCKLLIYELVQKVIVRADTIDVNFSLTVDTDGGGGGN